MKNNRFSHIVQILTENLGLKILSAVIAIIIWYVVIDNNDPIETASYTVHVEITNQSYIMNGKQTFTVDDEYTTVVVYVKGNRSNLKKLQASNVLVTADLTQIVSLDLDPVCVPLQVSCAGFSQENITLSRTTIPITIENISSQDFSVVVDQGGSVPGQNYEVGTAVPSTDTVTISGPESLINKIGSVIATIDVTGMTSDATVPATLSLIDKDQVEMPSSSLENLTINGGVSSMDVAVSLWKRQSGIVLKSEYSGTPAEGYQVSSVSVVPSEITVVGDEAALKELSDNGNEITIPGNLVSAGDANKDITVSVDIARLLPNNCRLGSSINSTAAVTLAILPVDSQEYTCDVDDVQLIGLADNLTVSYDKTELKVRVQGTEKALDSLKKENIGLSIDLTGKTSGDYTVPIQITLPDGCSLVEEPTIPIHLKMKADAS